MARRRHPPIDEPPKEPVPADGKPKWPDGASLLDWLRAMPDDGNDEDFDVPRDLPRDVDL